MALGVFFDYSVYLLRQSLSLNLKLAIVHLALQIPCLHFPILEVTWWPWAPQLLHRWYGCHPHAYMASALSAEPSPHQSLYFLFKATQKCQKTNRFKISCHSHDYANTTKQEELTFLPKEKNGEFIRALTIIRKY